MCIRDRKSSSCFPLRHYHGSTILLDLDAISPEMRKQMEWYGVDLDVIRRYICTEHRCCIPVSYTHLDVYKRQGETMADKIEKGILTLYSDVQATSVRWLWYPFIAVGKITLLQGDPDVYKRQRSRRHSSTIRCFPLGWKNLSSTNISKRLNAGSWWN